MKKALFLFYLLMAAKCFAQSNEGTEFWLAFMEHVDSRSNTMVAMITSRYDTQGQVSMAGINWSSSFSVAANQVTLVRLPVDAENVGSEAVRRLGIRVTSVLPVSVYMHQHSTLRSDASIVLPVNVLGKEYYTMNYQGFSNAGRFYPSEFVIVGIEDATEVKILPKARTVGGKVANSLFQISLNRGETYQVQGFQTGDMTGSHIESNKPVAVYAGNAWTEIPSGCPNWDNLLEAMPPVDTWGKQYISVPSRLRYEKIRILASHNNTNITVSGATTRTASLQQGQMYEFNTSEAVYISSDQPVMVAKFFPGRTCSSTNSNGDPAMLVLNSIEQTRDSVVMYNSSLQNIEENYISVIMLTEDAQNVQLDGQNLSLYGQIEVVPGNPKYSYLTVQVQTGSHQIFSAGCGVIAYAFGFGNAESYAYGGGAAYKSINQNPIIDGGCAGEEIQFLGGQDTLRFKYLWEFEDGSKSTQPNYSRFFPDTGRFNISLQLYDRCLDETQNYSQDILISRRQLLGVSPPVAICEDEQVTFQAQDLDEVSYTWRGPDGTETYEQNLVFDKVQSSDSGRYQVVGNYFGCESFPADTRLDVFALPEIELENEYIFCNKDGPLELSANAFEMVVWDDGSSSQQHAFDQTQNTGLTVTDHNGCRNTLGISVVSACPPSVAFPNVFKPGSEGINGRFTPLVEDVTSSRLDIFDRWGNQVFSSDVPESTWDGNFNGSPCVEGVYTYLFQYEGFNQEGELVSLQKTGSFVLIK